jgi:hypothetical protein
MHGVGEKNPVLDSNVSGCSSVVSSCDRGNEPSGVTKDRILLNSSATVRFSGRALFPCD